jgi:hypothetical protein
MFILAFTAAALFAVLYGPAWHNHRALQPVRIRPTNCKSRAP